MPRGTYFTVELSQRTDEEFFKYYKAVDHFNPRSLYCGLRLTIEANLSQNFEEQQSYLRDGKRVRVEVWDNGPHRHIFHTYNVFHGDYWLHLPDKATYTYREFAGDREATIDLPKVYIRWRNETTFLGWITQNSHITLGGVVDVEPANDVESGIAAAEQFNRDTKKLKVI